MNALMDIQNINIQHEMVTIMFKKSQILVNIFTITEILTNILDYINIYEYYLLPR